MTASILRAAPDGPPAPADAADLPVYPGRVIGLEGPTGLGLTRIGLSMLSATPASCRVVVDVRGWLCPLAAWEVGIDPDHLTVVRCDDAHRWSRALAVLLDGVKAIYAEVPRGVKEARLRRLGAKARARKATVILRPLAGSIPSGMAFMRMRAVRVEWVGAREGHGSLDSRTLGVELSGKGAAGQYQMVEVEDDGTRPVRVVSRLVTPQIGRSVG
ncbi:MAG: hypothetical protein F4X18_12795 [Acidimicrobiia bacterium]|nr:hypothetical protein [Acidimicrobiia bacterium]